MAPANIWRLWQSSALARSIDARLRPWHERPCSDGTDRAQSGRFGERAAESYLRDRGYRCLYRNYRIKTGEIDLVCRHGEVLVFVEVRARSSDQFGRPSETVTPDKQRRVAKAALSWLRLLDNPRIYFRFDIVEIFLKPGFPPDINLIPNAFDLPEPYLY